MRKKIKRNFQSVSKRSRQLFFCFFCPSSAFHPVVIPSTCYFEKEEPVCQYRCVWFPHPAHPSSAKVSMQLLMIKPGKAPNAAADCIPIFVNICTSCHEAFYFIFHLRKNTNSTKMVIHWGGGWDGMGWDEDEALNNAGKSSRSCEWQHDCTLFFTDSEQVYVTCGPSLYLMVRNRSDRSRIIPLNIVHRYSSIS